MPYFSTWVQRARSLFKGRVSDTSDPDRFDCPACGFRGSLPEPVWHEPWSYEFCFCCGYQFGFTDGDLGYCFASWREKWVQEGMIWQGTVPPPNWSPEIQLAGFKVAHVGCDDEQLIVALKDSRTVAAPLTWFPRLLAGTPAQRGQWQLADGGYGIRWPGLTEDLSMEDLLHWPTPLAEDGGPEELG